LDKARIRRRLIALREELQSLEDTSREAASTVELDQSRVGRLSRMDALQAQEISKESRRRRALLLLRIEPALKRLELDEYGRCVDCDEAIAPARMEFDPTCTTCISCAEGREST
jgi:DnaK suppressor protein